MEKDPHIHFAHGGQADFRGRDGQLYAFLSAPGLAVNLKTQDATFDVPNIHSSSNTLLVDGSFITEVHLIALVGGAKRKLLRASCLGGEIDENNHLAVRGDCGGRPFYVKRGGRRTCDELTVRVRHASATISAGNWSVAIKGARSYATAGPEHRLDLGFSAMGDFAARNQPHGLFGQSFSSPLPRVGKVDVYPTSGHFRTSAMAEGAIDGEAASYEVASPYATAFHFTRFDERLQPQDQTTETPPPPSEAGAAR